MNRLRTHVSRRPGDDDIRSWVPELNSRVVREPLNRAAVEFGNPGAVAREGGADRTEPPLVIGSR